MDYDDIWIVKAHLISCHHDFIIHQPRPKPSLGILSSNRHNTRHPILSKDILVNPSRCTSFRILLPRELILGGQITGKLPLIVCYHGGGFILYSATSSVIDNCFEDLAMLLPVVVVSVEYHLAPEHRLPAAYDDALEALEVIRTTKEGWLTTYADLSNCYLMSGNAGANIAYNAGLCIVTVDVDNPKPLNIRGLILQQPFFGGMKRTESELRLFDDKILPLAVTDLMWELALPVGADRNHEWCNPTADDNPGLMALEKVRSLGWRVLVTGCSGNPLVDRQIELVQVLGEKGVMVSSQFSEGHYHAVEVTDRERCKILVQVIKHFRFRNHFGKLIDSSGEASKSHVQQSCNWT